MKPLCLALALLLAAPLAGAQQWSPTKPLRIIVPFPAGGIVDLMARTINEKLAAQLGQPVLIETRPGAMSSIGTESVARGEPDGHTLLLATLSHATLPSLAKVPWHPVKDFSGVAMLGHVANLAVVTPALEPKTLAEFVAYARARPGKLNFINAGNGTSQTLTVELFRKNAKLDLVAVGYRGYAPAMPDLLSGQIQFSVVPFGVGVPHVRGGKLRALAVVAPGRNKQLPETPTMAEAGFPESQVVSWYAFLVSSTTPRPIVQRLNAELVKAHADADVLARIDKVGGEPLPTGTPAEVDQMLAKEYERWAGFIKETGLKAE
jgi:tripartite-type tricarboxylate transporter receptor subunit TctC